VTIFCNLNLLHFDIANIIFRLSNDYFLSLLIAAIIF